MAARNQKFWRNIGALSLLGALFFGSIRSFRRRGIRRAFLSATLAGIAIAAFSIALAFPFFSANLIFLLLWVFLTHLAMAFGEGIVSALILAPRRMRPMRAYRGALLAAISCHGAGVLVCLVLFWRHLPSFWEDSIPLEGFLLCFAPFAPVGALLASLGTIYGDVVPPERTTQTNLPG